MGRGQAALLGAVFDERDGPLPGLLLALTVLAGIVDATSILALGDVFVAAIRNLKIVDLPTVAVTLTLSGLITERNSGWDAMALRRVGAVLAFFTGALVGGLLVHFVSLTAALALGLVIIIAVALGAHRASSAQAEWTRPRTRRRPSRRTSARPADHAAGAAVTVLRVSAATGLGGRRAHA